MKKYIYLASFLFFASTSVAMATTDVFTIEMRITNDTTPPSTPANVTATPITTTQIDVTWDAATDNDILAGYKVFRDASQIATTTLLEYSDTGLTASTTYSYYIQAYDVSGNVSSSSVAVSTTTLPLTPTTTPSTSTTTSQRGAQGLITMLSDMDIAVSQTDAVFTITGTSYISYTLRWGKTTSYELGFVQSGLYREEHITRIPELEPGQRYYYELSIYDRRGRQVEQVADTFSTTPAPQKPFVPNVATFTAVRTEGGVALQWDEPTTPNATVRLVQNPRFYPQHDADGYVLYEGDATTFTDTSAATRDGVVYYALFVVDQYGNRSSGALAVVTQPKDERTTEVVPSEGESVPFATLRFEQNDEVQPYQGDVIELSSRDPFAVQLPVFDTKARYVILTLVGDQYRGTYSMRRDYEEQIFTAIVPPLVASEYDVYVQVFDAAGIQYKLVHGTLRTITPQSATPLVSSRVLTFSFFVMVGLLGLFILVLRWLFRRSDADN